VAQDIRYHSFKQFRHHCSVAGGIGVGGAGIAGGFGGIATVVRLNAIFP
jgi:hypothetical protein